MTDKEYRYAERVLYGYKEQAEKCAELRLKIAELRAKGDIQVQKYNFSQYPTQ